MTLELLSSACIRGFTTEPPTCIEFSPCGQRLAFCSPRGAICIANIAGTPSICTMSPPGGHFASALSWENDEYLWVALSNGHVIQLHLPLSGSTFTISDWLTYRFPSDSCVQKILRLLQHALVAVAFADRVEVWRRTSLGDWTFEAVLRADGDVVDNLWSIMPDTLAVHYRRRGLCYWNHSDASEATAELCSNEWVSSDYRVAFNDKEELFAAIDGQHVLVYILDKFFTQGLARARIRRREAYRRPGEIHGLHCLNFVSAGASAYLALAMRNRLTFCTIHTAHVEDSMKFQQSLSLSDFDQTPKIACLPGALNRVALAGTQNGVGVVAVFVPSAQATATQELVHSKTPTVEYGNLLRDAIRRRKIRKIRAKLAFAARGASCLAALGLSTAFGFKHPRTSFFVQRVGWFNSTSSALEF